MFLYVLKAWQHGAIQAARSNADQNVSLEHELMEGLVTYTTAL
jgi:hypothetical protein